MKRFVIFIAKIGLVILLTAYALDFLYTYVYSKSTSRNKIESIINGGKKDYDVIMLGSSRAENHFVAQLFADKGLKAYNYGMSGATLEETLLELQLMIDKKYSIKNIILEVDLNIRAETYSEGTRARFMPYLTTNQTISEFYKEIIPEFNSLYYIPFYRYVEFDSQIGLREMLFAANNKKSNNLKNLGFNSLEGIGKNMEYDLSKFTPIRNKYYEAIKQICKEQSINLIVLSTPMCANTKGIAYFDKINTIYPEVINYENVVVEDKYFFSCGHMNESGARIFTERILNDFFSDIQIN